MSQNNTSRWRPIHAGFIFAGIATLLIVMGIFEGHVPLTPRSVGIALLIGAGSWGGIAWLVASTLWDVETDTEREEEEIKHL